VNAELLTTQHGPLRSVPALLLDDDPLVAAQALLGAVLERGGGHADPVRVRLVEVEAYGPDDPASHAYRGRTPRCASMFAPSGTAYVYRSYGVHWCLNVSVGGAGIGAAVLVRSAVVLEGVEVVRQRRPGVPDPALLRGPGCLTRGLGIDSRLDGADLLSGGAGWRLTADDLDVEARIGPRVGVTHSPDVPWRVYVPGCVAVSSYRRSPRASERAGRH
jgi:DNA-3-methyladenine glycosylase